MKLDNKKRAKNGKSRGKKKVPQLRLNTVRNTRISIGALIRCLLRGEIASRPFRDVMVGMARLAEIWRLEKDLQIESRLDLIEEKINAVPKQN
jgi:hypothetical protein